MFSDHSENKLRINNRSISKKFPQIWKLKNTILNNPWIKTTNQQGNLKLFELNANETTT